MTVWKPLLGGVLGALIYLAPVVDDGMPPSKWVQTATAFMIGAGVTTTYQGRGTPG